MSQGPDGGESSGLNSEIVDGEPSDDYNSSENDLNETGDIGIGDHIYSSYQKSGYNSPKKSKSIMTEIDGYDDGIDINASPKPRQSSTCLWFHHPRVRDNWKTVAGAIFLLVIGVLFLICGIVLSAIPKHDGPKSIIFFVCAAICILPGGYHTVYIYRAIKGWRGYNFESLPSFR